MEQRKDIGKIIEERLQDTVEAPTGLKWDRVSASLDRRDRKHRLLFFIWSGVAVTGLAILALLFYNGYAENEHLVTSDSTTLEKQPESNREAITTNLDEIANEVDLLPKETTVPVTKLEQHEKNGSLKEEKSQVVEVQKKELQTTQTKVSPVKYDDWTTNKNQDDITKTFTVDSVTTYRYYNHDTQNELITTDKKTIDSLVKLSERTKDSIN